MISSNSLDIKAWVQSGSHFLNLSLKKLQDLFKIIVIKICAQPLYFFISWGITSMNIILASAIMKYRFIILGFPFNKTKKDEWNISDQTSDIQRLQPVLQARGLSGQTATLLSTSVMSPGKRMLMNFIKRPMYNGFFRNILKKSRIWALD